MLKALNLSLLSSNLFARKFHFHFKVEQEQRLIRRIEEYIEAHGLKGESLNLDQRNLVSYLRHYQQPTTLDAYRKLITGLLAKTTLRPGARCLDYGCWYGISTTMMSMMGLNMIGADINPKSVSTARSFASFLNLRGIEFTDTGILSNPGMTHKLDGIFINDVLCSANPSDIAHILRKSARLLAPGGHIMISDHNNVRNTSIMTMLRQRWKDYELGSGTAETPAGAYYLIRREFLAQSLPGLSKETLDRLARESCYLWGEQLLKFAKDLADGNATSHPFNPSSDNPPVQAHDGCTFGTALDVTDLARILREEGLRVTVHPNLQSRALTRSEEATYEGQGIFIISRREK